MHRSGTSAATQLLALAGADLPANLMPGDAYNERGYFEPWKIAMFNNQRLHAAGGAWDDVFGFPHRALPKTEEAAWLRRAKNLIVEEYGPARRPLIKDPRATLLLPFWRAALQELEIGARCVIPVRHPLAVASSLSRRNGFPRQKAVLLWSAYMLAAEAYSRDLPRVFVAYDALLNDWRAQAARIETAHQASLPGLNARAAKAIDQFLTSDLRHNQADGDLADLGWAGALTAKVLAWFDAAAADEISDRAPLEAAARELATRRADIGDLVSPTTRDLDIVRTELHEAQMELDALRRERAQIEALIKSVEPDA